MLSKNELADTLGLSCVEKYFLAWLNGFYDVTKLYGCSFVSLPQVFDDFARGATYQNYCYLPRLQDTAEDYGIVAHEYKVLNVSEAKQFLQKQPKDKLCLMRVNSAFFTDYKRAAWREDHYVCVNGEMEWINEYPLSMGVFDDASFARVYDGAISTYEIKAINVELPDLVTAQFAVQDYSQNSLPNSLPQLESAFGVLKITRKRLEKFFAHNEQVKALLSDENALLDRMYFNARLRQLKNTDRTETAIQDIYTDIRKVVDIENKIAEVLSK